MALFDRTATIRIKNDTGYDLKYVDKRAEHGKFSDNPPSKIANGATGKFKVTNTGTIGPKGYVWYDVVVNDLSIRLTFFYNHPESGSASTYSVSSDPPFYATYYLDPSRPTGHTQDVTINTFLSDHGYQPAKWMADMKPETKLRSLLLPGSHDSGSYDIGYLSPFAVDYNSTFVKLGSIVNSAQPWARAQGNSIRSQLDGGVRYFDLRVSNGVFVTSPVSGQNIVTIGPDKQIPILPTNPPQTQPNVVRSGTFYICHAFAGATLGAVLDDVGAFLQANPKEIVLLNFQHFYNMQAADYDRLIDSLRDKLADRMMVRPTGSVGDLKLSDFWNKGLQAVVLFEMDHQVTVTTEVDADVKLFKDRQPAIYNDNKEIWSSPEYMNNRWPNKDTIDKLDAKLSEIVKTDGPDQSKFFVLQGIISPSDSMYANIITNTVPWSLEQLGNQTDPVVLGWVGGKWKTSGLNAVMLDWVMGSNVSQVCYLQNKATHGK